MGWSRTNALDEIKTLTSYGRHHRLLLLDRISPQDPVSEIEYIHGSLLPDPKNYHTWAYLHWLYSHFSTLGRISEAQWGSELDWCNEMLRVDGRNNSAWGWRWYLRVSRPGAETSSRSLQDELMWVIMLSKFKDWHCGEVISWSQFTSFHTTYLRGITSVVFSSTSHCHLCPSFQLFYHTPPPSWTPILKLSRHLVFLCLRIRCPRILRCLSLWPSNILQTLLSNRIESMTLLKCLRSLAPSMTRWGPDTGNSDEGNVLKNNRAGLFLYDPCICGYVKYVQFEYVPQCDLQISSV